MDFRANSQPSDNRGAQPTQPQAVRPSGDRPATSWQQPNGKKWWIVHVVIATVLLLLAVGGYFLWSAKGNTEVKTNQYQALFLTNGQVYFGRLTDVNDSYVKLSEIYYLQVQQPIQPAQQKSGEQPQVSLAKLGSELHGPEDAMHVSRDQVLFWENLRDDSKVVQAIKQAKQ
ncbi:MAG: hypothetical protein ACREGJ_03785 [Candidatus Saccharimonadales bacterium]